MTYLFLATSIVAWTLLLVAHRRHVRAMRALAAKHKTALARKHIDSVRLGMMEERERAPAVVSAANAFCEAHREDYADLLNSESMDIDPEFMELGHAVFGPPVILGDRWVISTEARSC